MQEYFLEMKSFLIKFDLRSNTITAKVEYDWLWIVLDAAYNSVVELTGRLRVGPNDQLLQQTP